MEGKDKPKIVWNYDFETDQIVEHQRPEIVVLKINVQ